MRSEDCFSSRDVDDSDDDSFIDLYAHVERRRRIAQRRESEKNYSMSFNGRIDDVDTKSVKSSKVSLRRSLPPQSRGGLTSFLEHNMQPNKTVHGNRSYCSVPAVVNRSSEASVVSRRTVQVRAPRINSSDSATVGPRKTSSRRSDKPSTSSSSLSSMRSEAPSRRTGQLFRQLASRSLNQSSMVGGSPYSSRGIPSKPCSYATTRAYSSATNRKSLNSTREVVGSVLTAKLDELQAKQEELREKSQIIERNRQACKISRTRSVPNMNRHSSYRQFMAPDESSDRSFLSSKLAKENRTGSKKQANKSSRTRSDPNMNRRSSYRQFMASDESSDRSLPTSMLEEIQVEQEKLRGKSQVIERNRQAYKSSRTRSEPHINRLLSFRQFMAADESSDGCLSRPQNLTRFKLSKKSSGKSPR